MKHSFNQMIALVCLAAFVVTTSAEPIDPLEVRPTLVEPQVSLPTNLVTVPVVNPGEYFVPPLVDDIPDDDTGDLIRWGRKIFVDTQTHAARYTGNGLNCVSCHLAEGRQPYAMPLWGAYPIYPVARNKTRKVVTIQQRIQSCFKYSMDGIAPTVDAPEMDALVTYAKWLSTGAPVGVALPGRGVTNIKKTHDPASNEGEIIYKVRCAMCHGDNGEGQKNRNGKGYMFPPLWGMDSFNRGAGMNKVKTAAQFIKANMPLGSGYTLTDDEALDVASYMWIHFRPDDPRVSFFKNRVEMKPGGGGAR